MLQNMYLFYFRFYKCCSSEKKKQSEKKIICQQNCIQEFKHKYTYTHRPLY